MFVTYGSYSHQANLVGFSIDKQVRVNPRTNTNLSVIHTVKVDGYIKGSTQEEIFYEVALMQQAYSVNGLEWALYHDSGQRSIHYLPNDPYTALMPPRVKGIAFPTSDGPEYATQRRYTIDLEAEYTFFAASNEVLEFQESVTVIGQGGPRYVTTELVLGLPVRNKVAEHTKRIVRQRGSAKGWGQYPAFPAPMYGEGYINVEGWEQMRGSPKRLPDRFWFDPEGRGYGQYGRAIEYPISWAYEFTLIQPPNIEIPGNPNY